MLRKKINYCLDTEKKLTYSSTLYVNNIKAIFINKLIYFIESELAALLHTASALKTV